jgi:hypothetical protein
MPREGLFRLRRLDGPLWPRNGYGFSGVDLRFGVGAPNQTGRFVQSRAVASASGGREELFGEHKSPFRDPPD